jgi:leucyl aminopeptidase (aminopeptidase T)
MSEMTINDAVSALNQLGSFGRALGKTADLAQFLKSAEATKHSLAGEIKTAELAREIAMKAGDKAKADLVSLKSSLADEAAKLQVVHHDDMVKYKEAHAVELEAMKSERRKVKGEITKARKTAEEQMELIQLEAAENLNKLKAAEKALETFRQKTSDL